MGSEEEREVKVVDRRRFTESGDLKQDAPEPSEPEAPKEEGRETPSGPGARPSRESPTSTTGRRDEPPAVMGVDFRHLVDFLAQQAAIVLQGAEGIPANPKQARLFIDLLDVLQDKTKNNLTAEEEALLRDVLFQLRTAYVNLSPEGS